MQFDLHNGHKMIVVVIVVSTAAYANYGTIASAYSGVKNCKDTASRQIQ